MIGGKTRIERICECVDTLEKIGYYRRCPASELAAAGYDLVGCMIGELDQLSELHRLLYEEIE